MKETDMRFLKSLTLFLSFLFVLLSFLSCNGSGGGKGNGESSITGGPVVLEPENVAPTIVPSPSLKSEDEIVEVGFVGGEIILSAERSNGLGVSFDGLNKYGKPLWKACAATMWPVNPNRAIPEGFPTLVVPKGTAVTLCNRTGYDVESDQYVDFFTGDSYTGETLPKGEGVYIRVVTVNVPKPDGRYDLIEKGAFFGEVQYTIVISFE